MANANSNRFGEGGVPRGVRAGMLVVVLLGGLAFAASPAPADSLRKTAYQEARNAFQSSPTNAVFAWRLARACFDCSFWATKKSLRATYAEEGIAAAEAALRRDPRSAPALYYLALNQGQLADTQRNFAALSLVKQMARHLQRARQLDPSFDYGGPDRALGLLYRDAPGWPISVGSRKKARRHLERALALAPEYFENHLNLIETFILWHKRKEALQAYAVAQKRLPQARQRFAGKRWAASWTDWNRRWAEIEATVQRWREKEQRP